MSSRFLNFSKKSVLGSVVCFSILLGDEAIKLDTVYTTAKRTYEVSNQTQVNAESINERQVVNTKELLQGDASIAVGGGGNGAQKIYVRGMEDRMLRVTVDGAAQNGNAFHHQGNVQIDPQMLKSVVVSKGAANASVGPGALAGALAVTTKDASDFLRKGQDIGFALDAGFFTNLGYKVNANLYKRIYKDFGALVYFTQTSILNYRDASQVFQSFGNNGKNVVLGSNSFTNNLLIKLSGQVDENQTLSFGFNNVNDYTIRPFRSNIQTSPENPNGSEIFIHDINSKNITASYEYRPTDDKFPTLKVNAYDSIRSVNLNPLHPFSESLIKEDPEGTTKRAIVLENFGGDLKLTSALNDETHILEYGLNYQNMSVRDDNMQPSEQYATVNNVEVKNEGAESANIIGGYVQDTWSIRDDLILGFGSRYDVYYYFDKNKQNQLTQGFSPTLVLTYDPIENIELKAAYAFTTRGALPGDATLIRNSEIVIAKHLKPELANNIELDLDMHFGGLSFKGAVFYNNLLNYINSYGKDIAACKLNGTAIGECRGLRNNLDYALNTYGFETGLDYQYKGFNISLNVARSFLTAGGKGGGRILTDTYELGANWGYTFVTKIGYESEKFDISFLSRYVTGFGKDEQGWDIYNEQVSPITKPGYNVHNLYMNYYPLGKDVLALRFSILNIFNALYTDPTSPLKVEADGSFSDKVNQIRSALQEPGIDFRFQVSYKY